MARILLTGDWHIKNDEFNNIHIQSILNFLDYTTKYYIENDLDYYFVIGDVFHKSTNIKNEAFIPLFMKLLKMKEAGINFTFIPGNHDIVNVDNDTLVETFNAFGTVYKEKTDVVIDGHDFTFLPYTKKESLIPKSGEYLITHLSIADFYFSNVKMADEKIAFRRDLFEDFKLVITGHFHRHQYKGNICYIGSPVQVSRGEIGQEKIFGILDTETENLEFIPYDLGPKYIELKDEDLENISKMSFENCHVVVKINSKIKDFAKLRYILYEKGAISIVPLFESIENDKESVEINIEEISNVGEVVEDIILNSDETNNLDKKKLAEVFEKIKGLK